MPLVSILSPVYAPRADYLPETIASVRALVLPNGWELEWIVQEDGDAPALAGLFEGVEFARYEANGQRMPLSHTRNLALSRARGDLAQVLDHDDILLPHALSTLIPRFAQARVQWAVGQADDLLPNGERKSFPPAVPFGILPAGSVNDWAIDNGGNWPIHCAGLMARTATLRAIGGWVGVPIDDDIAMFAALCEVGDGYHEPTVTWLYRQHPQQTHRSAEWIARSAEGRRIALERVAALRHVRMSVDAASAAQPGGLAPVEVGPIHPMKDQHPV